MTRTLHACFIYVAGVTFAAAVASSTKLIEVLQKPQQFEGRHVDLVGIARVPGYFYLFADEDAAARTDLTQALLVRKNNSTQPEYRELDRQWVRVTGVMSSKPRRGYEEGSGVVLDRLNLLHDRVAPRIADKTVLGVFKNSTSEPVAISIHAGNSDKAGTIFFLGPDEVQETELHTGRAVVSQLLGDHIEPFYKREIGKIIADIEITFRSLPSDYEFSRETSTDRRLYFNVSNDRIEKVPRLEGSKWKIEGKHGQGRG